MASEAARGQTAIQARDYPKAITHLSNALEESASPVWLIQRSTAYQRNGEYEFALADADNAVIAARSRGKRELIASAHLRRAIALHGLKQYGNARLALNWAHKINEKESGLTIWMAKVKKDYEEAGGEEAESNQITIKEIPDKVEEVTKKGKGKEKVVEESKPVPVVQKATPKEKIRHEWYQSNGSVTVDLLASGVPKDKVEVKFEERELEISFPIADSNNTYDFTLSPLYYSIDPIKSSYRVTPKKIEITLSKAVPGKWASLEWATGHPTEPEAPTLNSKTTTSKIPSSILSDTTNIPDTKPKGPSYPTSSRTGPKNWDTIVGDEGDDDEDKDDPNGFFKTLYKGADDDTKKAMMKSFSESGGTSLSTDWSDVKKKTFVPQPPDGMEAKTWER